jgi:riboflavin-specific deaminase-like protein
VLAAAHAADEVASGDDSAAYAVTDAGGLRRVAATAPDALLAWKPGAGWESLLPPADPRRTLVDLYLPICSATAARPVTVAHLGQSLDGFIATSTGESQWITGGENLLHTHRLRALCDAVVVGAGTVAADDPQLTTRLVAGSNPLRVVIDPARRLDDHHRVFQDGAAETLYVCGQSSDRRHDHHVGRAGVAEVGGTAEGLDVLQIVTVLRERGCARIFVEGGGVTVSAFLEASALDRLHVAVAPLLIGNGRPAIRLSPRALEDCPRPSYRLFRMGADVLFDFDLRSTEPPVPRPAGTQAAVTRIL